MSTKGDGMILLHLKRIIGGVSTEYVGERPTELLTIPSTAIQSLRDDGSYIGTLVDTTGGRTYWVEESIGEIEDLLGEPKESKEPLAATAAATFVVPRDQAPGPLSAAMGMTLGDISR